MAFPETECCADHIRDRRRSVRVGVSAGAPADAERRVFPLKAPRRFFALIVAAGAASPSMMRAQSQRAVLELLVNQVSVGEALVVLRGSDVLVGIQALTDAGLQGIAGEREPVGGQEFVSLSTLAPAVSFRVDETGAAPAHHRCARAAWRASAQTCTPGRRRISSSRPTHPAFSITLSTTRLTGRPTLFTESALSVRGALLYNTFSATRHAATRGLTSVTIDQRAQMRRWTYSATTSVSRVRSGAMPGSRGITVAKEFAINPYFVRHPTLSLSTPIAVPSVMEVQVNGQVVSREQVAPGRLDIRNLPLTLGRNDAQVIIRDAFGVERELVLHATT